MSGYLDHMLARASGRGPVLRPRPRSRFEPTVAGPADLAVWPESMDGLTAERPEPGPADGPTWHQPDPAPRAVSGSAPEPRPGRRQARAQATPLAATGSEPFEDEPTVGPFGIKEPDTERTSSDQPPMDLIPRRASPVTAAGATERLPSTTVSTGPVIRATAARPVTGSPEPGDPAPARRLSLPREAQVPDQPPRPAPADLADPAPAITAARGRPSRPPARRPARRVSASVGEPSPVPAGPPALTDAPITADPPVPAASRDVADAPAAARRRAADSPEPGESPARAHPPTADPAGPLTVAREPTGADPTDMTGGPLADPFAILGPVSATQAGIPGRPPPSQDVTPAPVVNVTIGRVEVRPPPAPLPPPPVRAPGPQPLSLDEYLERRNSGPS